MSMQEMTRYEAAAAAIHAAGRRVTVMGVAEWLREHEGRGCSPREALPVARHYRAQADADIERAAIAIAGELERLKPWMRALALKRARKVVRP